MPAYLDHAATTPVHPDVVAAMAPYWSDSAGNASSINDGAAALVLMTAAEAKKRGSKSVVRREVVRIITPGTLTEDTLLDARRSNFLGTLAVP